jgi:hypothetical protein
MALPSFTHVDIDHGFVREWGLGAMHRSDEERVFDAEKSLARLAGRDHVSSLIIHLPWDTTILGQIGGVSSAL